MISAPSTSGLSVEFLLRVIDVKCGFFTLLNCSVHIETESVLYITYSINEHFVIQMAHDGQHRTPLELISQNLRSVLIDVLNKLECGDVDNSIDFARYRVEWLCSVILRLGGSLEQSLLSHLQEAQQLLAILDMDNYFRCTSYHHHHHHHHHHHILYFKHDRI